MFYLTLPQKEVWGNEPNRPYDPTGTITYLTNTVKTEIRQKYCAPKLIQILETFNAKYADLFEKDRKSLYREFYIPKRKGGLRRIDAPNDELMTALRDLKNILEKHFGALYHTSAFAYIKGRSTLDAVKKHQKNESRWFLKTDFSQFFPSTTEDFLMYCLSMIYPYNEITCSYRGKTALRKSLSLCFLNGGLPQGTPTSPLLTNLMMIPFDHSLFNKLASMQFVYTRYADDIFISHRYDFNPNEIITLIDDALEQFHAPFLIKPEKTRYGSSAGQNFILGCMLNRENKITLGWRCIKRFKAMCSSFICDYLNGQFWSVEDTQVLQGKISYYQMISPGTVKDIISRYNEKYQADMMEEIKTILKGGVVSENVY